MWHLGPLKKMSVRIKLWLTILIIVPTILGIFIVGTVIIEHEKEAYKNKLLTVTVLLKNELDAYMQNITDRNMYTGLPKKEQIDKLNVFLQPIVDKYCSIYPELGMGFYSIDLDSVVAIGPNYEEEFLKQVPRSYPYFKTYETGRPEFSYAGNPIYGFRQTILNATMPIFWDNKIIGHAWASIPLNEIYMAAFNHGLRIFIMGLIVLVIVLRINKCFTETCLKSLIEISDGIIDEHADINIKGWPELRPIIDKIKEHKIQLLESEEKYRSVFENSMDGICITGPEEEIIAVNPAFCRMLGMAEAEVRQTGKNGIADSSDPKMDKLLTEREEWGYYKGELTYIHKNGTKIPVEVTSQKYKSTKGEEYTSSIVRDLSEKKKVQKEMARLDRLDLIGQVSASIAHEVRNPITTIRGFLQLLGMKKEFKSFQQYIGLMIDEVDRASGIITEFLSLAQNKPINLKNSNLNTIITTFLPVLEAEAIRSGKNILTELNNVPDIRVDTNEIRQLILNLVKNGFEAMEIGKNLLIRTFHEGGTVVLVVKDEGTGIPDYMLDKIGQSFATTKERGTGLGLQVCYSIAARHKAVIEFKTGPEGTSFFVKFKTKKSIV